MSELIKKIDDDLKVAMKAKDKERTGALRLVRAAIQNKRIDKRDDLNDEDVLAVLSTMVKQRKDSIEQFEKGGREDLAAKEQGELDVIMGYMPAQMGEEEVRALVSEAIAATGAAGPKEMGKVMGALMPKVKGRADGKMVNEIVRSMLAG